jgi:hypothetical protein
MSKLKLAASKAQGARVQPLATVKAGDPDREIHAVAP